MEIKNLTDGELKLTIKTNNQDTFSLPIQGELDCIIVETNQKIQLIIESELGYLILHRNEINGVHYLAPRARTTYPIEKLIDTSQPTKFNLNENIIVTVIGANNTEVNLTFRLG